MNYVNKITDLIEGYTYIKEMFDKTNNLYAEYEFKLKEHNNIYQELLSENEKLRARIDRNEIMIKEIIDDKRKNYISFDIYDYKNKDYIFSYTFKKKARE